MKKIAIVLLSGAVILSSCSTTESGANSGAWFGSILGSAIGGLSDGPRGSDWGTIIGMAGGAVVGGAIGNAQEKATKRKLEKYHERIKQKEQARHDARYEGHDTRYEDDGYFDPQNGGDDRIEIDGMGIPSTPIDGNTGQPVVGQTIRMEELTGNDADVSVHVKDLNAGRETLQISNIRFIDNNGDGILQAGETAKITFELRNRSHHSIHDVRPLVTELTGNRQVMVSPSIEVESIAPGSGIRYTATVVATKRLKTGELQFQLSALYGSDHQSKSQQLHIATQR